METETLEFLFMQFGMGWCTEIEIIHSGKLVAVDIPSVRVERLEDLQKLIKLLQQAEAAFLPQNDE